jgi:hypothetical protein
MSDNKSADGPSWWQTLPGILTGLAAIITAVTGLFIAFNRTGTRSEPAPPQSSSPTPAVSRQAQPASTTSPSSSGALPLPEVHQVKLADGGAVITILSARLEPLDAERRSLTFVLRYLNTGHRQANFWSSSFRLIVDDVPRAPTNFLDELVDGESAKEGTAVFELPNSVKSVVFQISSGDEKRRVPFTLP